MAYNIIGFKIYSFKTTIKLVKQLANELGVNDGFM